LAMKWLLPPLNHLAKRGTYPISLFDKRWRWKSYNIFFKWKQVFWGLNRAFFHHLRPQKGGGEGLKRCEKMWYELMG
jgi:hypothetical protein